MPFSDEADDESGFVPPLPPDDRLWRHPSEQAATRSPAVGATPRRHRGPLPVVVAVGVLIAVIAGITVVSAISEGSTRRSAAIAETGLDLLPVAVHDRVSPALVRVTVERSDGTSTTTGLMVRADGHLVTTADAVLGATSISVRVADGSTYNARLVGIDRTDDIAVFDTDVNDAPTAPAATADRPAVGDRLLAIAITRDGSYWTANVAVDALHQRVAATDGSTLMDMVHATMADAPSTGTAVVCTNDGAVIGVLTARTPLLGTSTSASSSLVSTSRVSMWATPIAWIAKVATDLIETGSVHRPWIGVVGEMSDARGSLVRSVSSDGPAARAGILPGDLVTAIDAEPVDSAEDLALDVRRLHPGDRVTIAVERDGATLRLGVVVSEQT